MRLVSESACSNQVIVLHAKSANIFGHLRGGLHLSASTLQSQERHLINTSGFDIFPPGLGFVSALLKLSESVDLRPAALDLLYIMVSTEDTKLSIGT